MQITNAQVVKAQALVRSALADGRTPNPATVALANRDVETLAKIAMRLEIDKINRAQPRKRRRSIKK